MKIDVKKIAKLANLSITPEEESQFDRQLNDVVGYIEMLNSVDTSGVEPTAQVTGLSNMVRQDDKPYDSLTPEDALSGTSKNHNYMFVVDKLVDTTA